MGRGEDFVVEGQRLYSSGQSNAAGYVFMVTACRRKTWRGLRYLQGHSRGRGTGLFGEGSRHRAQLPQHRKVMRERERESAMADRERVSRALEVTRRMKSRKRRERKRCGREIKVRSEIKKRTNYREKLKAAVWCDILGGNDTGQSANMNELRKRREISCYSLNFSFCALLRANKWQLKSKPNAFTGYIKEVQYVTAALLKAKAELLYHLWGYSWVQNIFLNPLTTSDVEISNLYGGCQFSHKRKKSSWQKCIIWTLEEWLAPE